MTTSTVHLRPAHGKRRAFPAGITAGRRRMIDREAGRALEMLGHAIEYLIDEYAQVGGSISADDPVLQALQILMERNREIYFACPVAPTFGERLRALLRRHR